MLRCITDKSRVATGGGEQEVGREDEERLAESDQRGGEISRKAWKMLVRFSVLGCHPRLVPFLLSRVNAGGIRAGRACSLLARQLLQRHNPAPTTS